MKLHYLPSHGEVLDDGEDLMMREPFPPGWGRVRHLLPPLVRCGSGEAESSVASLGVRLGHGEAEASVLDVVCGSGTVRLRLLLPPSVCGSGTVRLRRPSSPSAASWSSLG